MEEVQDHVGHSWHRSRSQTEPLVEYREKGGSVQESEIFDTNGSQHIFLSTPANYHINIFCLQNIVKSNYDQTASSLSDLLNPTKRGPGC